MIIYETKKQNGTYLFYRS